MAVKWRDLGQAKLQADKIETAIDSYLKEHYNCSTISVPIPASIGLTELSLDLLRKRYKDWVIRTGEAPKGVSLQGVIWLEFEPYEPE